MRGIAIARVLELMAHYRAVIGWECAESRECAIIVRALPWRLDDGSRDANGWSALHAAAARGREEVPAAATRAPSSNTIATTATTATTIAATTKVTTRTQME